MPLLISRHFVKMRVRNCGNFRSEKKFILLSGRDNDIGQSWVVRDKSRVILSWCKRPCGTTRRACNSRSKTLLPTRNQHAHVHQPHSKVDCVAFCSVLIVRRTARHENRLHERVSLRPKCKDLRPPARRITPVALEPALRDRVRGVRHRHGHTKWIRVVQSHSSRTLTRIQKG